MDARGEIVWTPPVDAWSNSRLGRFAAVARPTAADYGDLLAWSLASPSDFWQAIARWAEVHWHDQPTDALATATLPGSVWFPGGTLNYAEQALRLRTGSIVGLSQSRDRIELKHHELIESVAHCRAGLRSFGVRRGDRVAAYLPNMPEAIVLFLATASIGAVFTSASPELGARAVVDRWSQLEPKVVVAVDGYQYGVSSIDRRVELTEIVGALPSVRNVVLLPYLDAEARVSATVPVQQWKELLATRVDEQLAFEPVPFDHPLYVRFASDTAGAPKPIVQGHGGILLDHVRTLGLHHDLGPERRFMWSTTTSETMWHYLVSGLCLGSTIVLFDGDPAFPDLGTLWRIAEDEHVDVLGVSAPFISACRHAGMRPTELSDLTGLRQLGSIGSPLPAEDLSWIGDAVGSHVQVASVSGGSDGTAVFVGATPTMPVRAGELSTRMLGCDVRAVDREGHTCPPDVAGDLVIGTPLPSMPVRLWGDADGSQLQAMYFATVSGMWHNGDGITFQDDGACVITDKIGEKATTQ